MTAFSPTRILVIGPFPPPHNGAAKNTAIWAENFALIGYEVIRINTSVGSGSAHARSIPYHFDRLKISIRNGWLLFNALNRESVVYIIPDGGLGLIYNVFFAAIFRLRRVRRIWMHHRNFHNIRTGSFMLRGFCSLVGSAGRHIFLTEEMQRAFEAKIGPAPKSEIISNAATCDVEVQAIKSDDRLGMLTVGFLSSLVADKGFDIVARGFELIARDVPDVRFVVGGEPLDSQSIAWAQALQSSVGKRVQMLGHLSGQSKSDFFRSVDIFVFPTTYKLEAQPNVILEALAAGASVVATDHACIPETLIGTHHRLIALEDRAEMAKCLASAVGELIADLPTPSARKTIAWQNIETFERMQRTSIADYHSFLRRRICDLEEHQ